MKKFLKWIAIIVILVVVVAISAASYVSFALPDVGEPENIKVELTPERLARGKYLAHSVAVCIDCHSTRDWSKFAGPIDSNQLGVGGEVFDSRIGLPGEIYVPNITPTGIKKYTDGELFRAITTGVKKDGSAIFPIMPWQAYSKMDREDIYAIIAYIRTLQPKGKTYPAHKLDFPLNLIVNTMPQKATLGKRPPESDTLKYGQYLVQTASCIDCHSQEDKGTRIAGLEFAGGRTFQLPGGVLKSANITPDKDTGIGSWTKEQFVNRFRQYAEGNMQPQSVKPNEYQTIMPWWKYGNMKESDLAAVYAYLRTIKPISNPVVKFQQVKH
ncbi:c-type cytochrome [Mucilaginibacter limnophilus]|uniref:C-type cytochrome n=1 Tax=Mucilaginibacter limnophilus TaxID=1932778 RepID=A0A3S2UZS9_9SPHI|nr:c-type cytochrome [Mucilaginibacter limnophilus]RVT98023.1 c-type cytochrome [Mucilaginibacter limnophilus]